jgi:LmbE family N-acetylglucosaminyl deacetylase
MNLTLMAVHAHPDDEVLGTGGAFARYSAEGLRTVLVTCTDGGQGDGPGGVKPGEAGHDPRDVAELRAKELRASAELLGIGQVEMLGYRDSGMVGWEANNHPEAFTNVPVDTAAARLTALMEHYRPQVVVTYDENGGYGHLDHIQAHRITAAAARASGVPSKLYHSAMPTSLVEKFVAYARSLGEEWEEDEGQEMGTPDEQITAWLDVAEYTESKRKALAAHASQSDSDFLLAMPPDIQEPMFAQETFLRVHTTVPAPDREDDLFAGLR